MKRTQTYTAPGITVTFDPNLCIHSVVCLRVLPRVFDVRRRRRIAPVADTPDRVARCRRGGTGKPSACIGNRRTNGFRPRRTSGGASS